MHERLASIDEYFIGPTDLDPNEQKSSEKSVENRSSDVARANGWLSRKYKTPSNRAAPDRVFMKDGRVIFIEYKRPGKMPTPQQRMEAAAMLDRGITVYWTDSRRGTKEALGII